MDMPSREIRKYLDYLKIHFSMRFRIGDVMILILEDLLGYFTGVLEEDDFTFYELRSLMVITPDAREGKVLMNLVIRYEF